MFHQSSRGIGVAVGINTAVVTNRAAVEGDIWQTKNDAALTIEAVMVDTGAIQKRRDEAKAEAERAVARKIESDRRAQELQARKERQAREKQEADAAEKKRQKDIATKKRQEDLRLQNLRKQQEQDRKDQAKRQQDELDRIREQRAEAARQRAIEEEKLKQ